MKKVGLAAFILISISTKAQRHQDSIHVYYKCVNKMAVSQLFATFKPDEHNVKIKGARLAAIDKSNKNNIAIIPDSAVVTVYLQKKNKMINEINLYSLRPPAPIIELNVNGKTYFSFGALSGPPPTSLEVSLVADEVFRLTTPNDAHYRIAKWEVALRRSSQTLKLITLSDKIAPQDLANIQALAKPGDLIQIKLLSVQRQNAVGEWIDQALTRSSLLYSITK